MSFSTPYSYSPFSYEMELDDPVAYSLSFSSLSISPPQTLPSEMDLDEEPSSFFSSQAFQNPFISAKCGSHHPSCSDGRPKNPFAGESSQKRQRSKNSKAKTETKALPHRGGEKKVGKAENQKQQLKGAEKPKPKGQQRKQQPRQPKQNRGPQRAEAKEKKPVNPFLVPLASVKGQGQRR
ncbi:uncharacterized protein LY79DRAFT_674784 [Colletotrichum navitas]|uniref:Uncharacterized protein n=1 Tax=Colletotrichum navitas TaxID=681940 RepID=A0AAD8UY31_9PEZI|nr:uncharacterized protein LY79DRAFT_674784 [Colletotrichum navitas]KAK1566374.1 hypothetical protein LY79DRAFT_674784 [Colletotrichum navitas]